MSIMSGLVETGSPHPVAPHQSMLSEWFVRHAWGLVIAGSIAFWVILGGAFILG